MRIDEDSQVVYIQCPHCKKGWYGKQLSEKVSVNEDNHPVIEEFVVEGLAPTDITKPLICLNCGETYQPITHVEFDPNSVDYVVCNHDGTTVLRMWDFVAYLLTTCKGN